MIYFLSSLNIKTSYYTTRQNVPSITLSLHFFTFSFNISIFINHHNIYPTPHGNSLIPHNSLFFIIKALNVESFLFFVLIHHTLAIFAIEIIAFSTYNLSVVSHLLQVLVLLSDKHLNKIICKKKTAKTLIKSFGCFFIHQKRICIYCLFFNCYFLRLAPFTVPSLVVSPYINLVSFLLFELFNGT